MSERVRLGRLITSTQHRDAVHVAVAPVTAAYTLFPGQVIGFITPYTTNLVGACTAGSDTVKPVGIVDPWLAAPVHMDEMFWMLMMPNTVSSLRHDWQHPAWLPGSPADIAEARQAIKWLAAELRTDYDSLMQFADNYVHAGFQEFDTASAWSRNNFHGPRFWPHYQIVRGVIVEDHNGNIFDCGC